MTRQPHDQFAKQYLEELLSPFGKVEVSREITTNPEDMTEEDEEIIMNFKEVYERERTNILQQERRQVVENLLRVRFGSLDEELSGIVEPMLQLPPEEYTRFCIELSREELLARFRR